MISILYLNLKVYIKKCALYIFKYYRYNKCFNIVSLAHLTIIRNAT